jgi:membrane protein
VARREQHVRRHRGQKERADVARRPEHAADGTVATPPRGWKTTLAEVWANRSRHNLSLISAGLAYYALLAAFPAMFAAVSVYGLIMSPAQIAQHMQSVTSLLPEEAANILQTGLMGLTESRSGTLSIGAIVGFLLALFSARAGLDALMTATNIAYSAEEKRGFIRRLLVSLALTVGAILGFVLLLLLAVAAPFIWKALGFSERLQWVLEAAQWVVLWLVIALGLAIVYRFAPCRKHTHWRWITVGSATSALLWAIASLAFSIYVSHFGSYGKTYGTISGVVVLLLWFYLSSYVILIGAEIDGTVEKQTARPPADPPAERHGLRRQSAGAHAS